MKKLIRITTVDFAQSDYMKGQNKYMSQYFEVVGAASDTGVMEEVAKNEGIRMVNIPMKRKMAPLHDLWCIYKFYQLFKKEKPDIVNSNSPKSSLLSMIAAKMAGVPYRIYTVSGLRYQTASGLSRWLLMTSEKIACKAANIVIPEGNGVMKSLINDGITKKEMHVIHHGNINGVNVDYYNKDQVDCSDLRDNLHIDGDDFVFVFVGRIVRDKGINELAEAMQRITSTYKKVKLLMVGDFEPQYGPLKPENDRFLKEDNSVVYAGYVKDVRPYLSISDALVFPSYREGFPNVVLQAGAMELPSIVTDINGSNEIIEDGFNGKIIPAHDTTALYDMMAWFIDHHKIIAEMGIHAREKVEINFKQSDVWNAWKKFYQSLD